MKLSFFIARKYFLSKKRKSFINIISIISMLAVALGTAALIIILSVFNGLTELIQDVHGQFDAEIRITPTESKTFELTDDFLKTIEDIDGVEAVTKTLEDHAFLVFYDNYTKQNIQRVVIVKGVGDNYLDQGGLNDENTFPLAPFETTDHLSLKYNSTNYALLGFNIANDMYMFDAPNQLAQFTLYHPDRTSKTVSKVNEVRATMKSYFSIETQYDENYVIVPFTAAERLFGYRNRCTSLEIKTTGQVAILDVQDKIKDQLGDGFEIKNKEEQHMVILKALKSEKLISFIILSIILLIASINIFFSLSMLEMEKRKDLSVLYAMGALPKTIARIFVYEGVLIAGIGALIGLGLGAGIIVLQQQVGIVPLNLNNAEIQYYPVTLEMGDFLKTILTVVTITILTSFWPAIKASKIQPKSHL